MNLDLKEYWRRTKPGLLLGAVGGAGFYSYQFKTVVPQVEAIGLQSASLLDKAGVPNSIQILLLYVGIGAILGSIAWWKFRKS